MKLSLRTLSIAAAVALGTATVAEFASAQTYPYFGPSAFVNAQDAASESVLEQPPVPPVASTADAARVADEAMNDELAARLDALEQMESRFGSLEKEWNDFRAGLDKKEKAAAEKPTMKINGRIHLDSWNFIEDSEGIGFFEHPDSTDANYGTDPEDQISFRRIRLEISGDIPNDMFYRMQVDFANPSEPQIKDVYLGFGNLPGNQEFIVGYQKRPLGLDHLNSSRFNVFLERPTVIDAFNEDARRLGMAFYGVTDDESWNWTYGLYNLENATETGRYIGDSLQLSGNVRLCNTPIYRDDGRTYFAWAVAGMFARPDGDASAADANSNEARFRARAEARSINRWVDTGRIADATWYEIAAVESIYNYGPFQVVGEYQTNYVQRDDPPAGNQPDLNFHGGYVYLSYFLTGEHIPWDRESGTIGRVEPYDPWTPWRPCGCKGWGAWNVALRYSYLDLSDEDVLGGIERDWTFALNWHWTAYSKLQFNAIYGDIAEHRPVNGFTSGNFWTTGVRFACDF